MEAARDDLAIALDRDLLAGERHLLDQRADGEGLLEALGGAIDRDLNHKRILTLVLALVSGEVFAAGAAYQVDTSEVSEKGACKVEAWYSHSTDRDAIAAVNPACVIAEDVELGAQLARGRDDGEYATTLTPKLKTKLRNSGVGQFGFAAAAGVSYDLTANDVTSFFAYVPSTVRLSQNGRINLNLGWVRDRVSGADHPTYGAGIDLRTSDNVWTLTAELFGQAVKPAAVGENQPRYQIGMRYRPVDPFNVDLIYGHNLIGEGRDWLTVSVIVRFR